MSFLDSLINGAQSFLGQRNAAARGGKQDAVEAFRYDYRLYDEMRSTVPAFSDMVAGFEPIHETAHDLTRDMLLEFYKGAPQVRDEAEMASSHILNQAVARMLYDAPETPEMRRISMVDKYSSVMATLAVADKVKEFLEEQKELLEEQAAAAEAAEALGGCGLSYGGGEGGEASNEAGQGQPSGTGALGALEKALSEALEAAEALGAEMGEFPGIGPLTEAQAEAMAEAEAAGLTLQEALAAAEAAADESDTLCVHFAGLADAAMDQLRPDVRAALEAARAGLENELNVMHAWGLEDGDIKKLSYPERAALAAQLLNNRFSQYASYIGRTRMVGSAQVARKVEHGREEVVGTELSGDVPRVLASEWARSRGKHRALRLSFLADLANGRLLSKKMTGTERVGKGAIICVVDNSDSMRLRYGSSGIPRELPAKATMLALLDEARRQRRDFACINFSSRNQQRLWRWDKGEAPITEVMECVSHFYGGGTDFERPLDMATELLATEYDGKRKMAGDIVFITDDDCRVREEWLDAFRETKRRLDFRVFGIAIGMKPGGALQSVSDNVRGVFDLTNSDEMTEVLRYI